MTLAFSDPATVNRRIDVLVVDDSHSTRHSLRRALAWDGYDIHVASSGAEGLLRFEEINPDVVVLELQLPDTDGIDVCRAIRAQSDAYLIVASDRSEEIDRVISLAVGADDFLAKPFSEAELAARVAAMLRRPRRRRSEPDIREFGALSVDPRGREVRVAGCEVHLTRIEFDLLDTLSSQPEKAFPRRELIRAVWGHDWSGDDHLVDVHVANLRKKIDRDGAHYIKTVRGIGYRMAPPAR